MTNDLNTLAQWVQGMTALLEQNVVPTSEHYALFLQKPELALQLIEKIDELSDEQLDGEPDYYSAYIFALDVCVAQLQSAEESDSKSAGKILRQLMTQMTIAIKSGKHTLSFWLPILNAFYEGHVELIPELKNAYLELASLEEDEASNGEVDHLNTIREMILELSDLSIFDIAENFFAQSYAMPADFFIDLIIDLYNVEQGHDIALLTLLHPKSEVREVVVAILDQLMENITLSSISLTRLQAIKAWYPSVYHIQFDRWIKIQRKKGVIFSNEYSSSIINIKASEVDGSGAQSLFIHARKKGKNQLCGVLFKQSVGIKDAWVTPVISVKDMSKYQAEAFDDNISFRKVEVDYFLLMVEHFLAITIAKGSMPDLHLLEIQELLGVHLNPRSLDITYLMEQLSVKIIPFTPDTMELSFKRSGTWFRNKRFTESWYLENARVDKLVNRYCSFVKGTKICALENAIEVVLSEEFEMHRDEWIFHFLWISLWANSKARKNEKIGHDSFIIAYAIYSGVPLKDVPIMHQICRQTVINSIETMSERRTYLNKE